MAKPPTTETIAAELTVPERVLLFCLASDTNWVKAGVSHSTAQHLLVRNLVERDHSGDGAAAGLYSRPVARRTVLAALVAPAPINAWARPLRSLSVHPAALTGPQERPFRM
jgi:hypothetical protein